MARKTYPVDDLKALVNKLNTNVRTSTQQRAANNSLLEIVLHHTGNYKGYQYVLPDGNQVPTQDVVDGKYDDSRRRYY